MKKIKLPNPTIMIFGSIGAFWLADKVNPGFNPVGILILLLIPVLIIDLLYPQPELKQLVEQAYPATAKKLDSKASISGDIVNNEPPTEAA